MAVARAAPAVVVGIGDDSAVLNLPAGYQALVTTDLSIEGVHFRRDWHPAEAVGHRCLARGLSDIAAMGGEPVAAFLSLGLPKALPQSWADRFLRGFEKLARKFRVPLGGGDVAESPGGVLADIVVLGRVPRGKALLRSGARPGDAIYVTGELGNPASVLEKLRRGGKAELGGRSRSVSEAAHFYPQPRLAVGAWLRDRGLATAAIDLSDGLSTDLGHICQESRVGAIVCQDSVPRARGVRLELALDGGEDYELLFTAPASRRVPQRIAGVRVTKVGEIVTGRRMWLVDAHGKRQRLEPRGWEHFVTRAGKGAVGRRPSVAGHKPGRKVSFGHWRP